MKLSWRCLALFVLLVSTGCDPLYDLEGQVVIDPSTDAPVIVQVVPFSVLDEDGLPEVGPDNVRRGLGMAMLVGGSGLAFRYQGFGCPTDVRVVAWVDVDGSSGLVPGDFRADGTATDDDDDAIDQDRFLDARPSSADRVAVSAPIHDPDCDRTDTPFSVALVPALR